MRTPVLKVDPENGPWPELAEAGRIVRDGGLVAFPTETVYGIAVNLRDEDALRRLKRLKGRPDGKPITVHLADADLLRRELRDLPRPAWKLAQHFWPGPLTLVLTDRMSRQTGYRVPDHAACREFLRAADCRVGGTSANASGDVPASTAEEVLGFFEGALDLVIDGGPARHAEASTVVRVVTPPPESGPFVADGGAAVEILRQGAIPAVEIREVTAKLIAFVSTENRCRSALAEHFASGMLARRLGVERSALLASGYRVESAGTGCLRGQPATPGAVEAGLAFRADLARHLSRPLTPTLLEDADVLFVMTTAQRNSILEFAPEAAPRVKLLDLAGKDILDPQGGEALVHEQTAERIHRCLRQRLDDL